jgi:hypothetical protein
MQQSLGVATLIALIASISIGVGSGDGEHSRSGLMESATGNGTSPTALPLDAVRTQETCSGCNFTISSTGSMPAGITVTPVGPDWGGSGQCDGVAPNCIVEHWCHLSNHQRTYTITIGGLIPSDDYSVQLAAPSAVPPEDAVQQVGGTSGGEFSVHMKVIEGRTLFLPCVTTNHTTVTLFQVFLQRYGVDYHFSVTMTCSKCSDYQ